MNKLVVTDLIKKFGNSCTPNVLSGASFTASECDTIAVVGPSGSGKSTLLNIIGSLDKPDSGSVIYDGTAVDKLEGEALSHFRSRCVGFIFQDHHLLPQLNAVENIIMPTLPLKESNNAMEKAAELLKRLSIADKSQDYPSTLSGGEKQRVAVARALINSPGLLLCDEPTGSLDAQTGDEIIALLVELALEKQVIVVVVTHNMTQADKLSRMLRLENGKLIPV